MSGKQKRTIHTYSYKDLLKKDWTTNNTLLAGMLILYSYKDLLKKDWNTNTTLLAGMLILYSYKDLLKKDWNTHLYQLNALSHDQYSYKDLFKKDWNVSSPAPPSTKAISV